MSSDGTRYFLWLYALIKKEEIISYRKMIKVLHNIQYYWSVPNDDNRAGDGIALREEYAETHNISGEIDIYRDPASVLEVLIGLARRMDAQLYSPDMGDRTSMWFWGFMGNLGLNQYSDERWGRGCEGEVRDIIQIFLDRKYDYNGNGGIFPLRKKPRQNQQTVELWYQMMAYFEERYPD